MENDNYTKEEKIIKALTESLAKSYPDEFFVIDSLAIYDKNLYGIKIYINEKGFLFDFDGSIKELTKYLGDMIEESSGNILECPFCKKSMQKFLWSEIDKCECGATIIHEKVRPNDLKFRIKEAGGIQAIAELDDENDWGIWFLNEESEKKLYNYNAKQEFSDYIEKSGYNVVSTFSYISEKIKSIEKITPNFIFSQIEIVGKWFCKWVFVGSSYTISHSNDSYDNSGELLNEGMDEYGKIKKYDNVGEWFEQEPIGYSEATYVSGCGLKYPTYWALLEENIKKEIERIKIKEWGENQFDDIPSEAEDEFLDIEDKLMDIFKYFFDIFSTVQCWIEYNEVVMDELQHEIAKEKEKEKKRIELETMAKEIWNKHFPNIKQRNSFAIGKLFDDFLNNLKNILPNLTKKEIRALKEYPKPHFSNKASFVYDKIMNEYLSKKN